MPELILCVKLSQARTTSPSQMLSDSRSKLYVELLCFGCWKGLDDFPRLYGALKKMPETESSLGANSYVHTTDWTFFRSSFTGKSIYM